MWVTRNEPEVNVWFALVFFPIWLFGMASYIRFDKWVAPRAADLWAVEHGYKILQLERLRGLAAFASLFGVGGAPRPVSSQVLYRVVALSPEGTHCEGWLLVGSGLWWRQAASRCPVAVRWLQVQAEEPKPIPAANRVSSPMWDETLDT